MKQNSKIFFISASFAILVSATINFLLPNYGIDKNPEAPYHDFHIYKIGKWLIGFLATLMMIFFIGGSIHTSDQINSLSETASQATKEVLNKNKTILKQLLESGRHRSKI